MLGFSSNAFWNLTYKEFELAFDGWKKANGVKDDKKSWTQNDVDSLRESIEAMKKDNPDGKPTGKLRAALKEARRARN